MKDIISGFIIGIISMILTLLIVFGIGALIINLFGEKVFSMSIIIAAITPLITRIWNKIVDKIKDMKGIK